MTNKLGCIVLVSLTHGDSYAYPLARSVNRESIDSLLAFARDFASTLALDADERIHVYLSSQSDVGAARLTGASERFIGEIDAVEECDACPNAPGGFCSSHRH